MPQIVSVVDATDEYGEVSSIPEAQVSREPENGEAVSCRVEGQLLLWQQVRKWQRKVKASQVTRLQSLQ